MPLTWKVESFQGPSLRIEYHVYYGVWSAAFNDEGTGGPAADLREVLAEATGVGVDDPWIVSLEDQIRADLVARGL